MLAFRIYIVLFGVIFSFVPSFSSQTLNLTTSPQFVNIGDLDVAGNQITVEALVRFTGGVNILSKHTGPPDVNYLMRIGTFELTTTTMFYLMANPYAGSMQPNTWYHVAGTYDGSFIRYYVNGCLIIEQAATGNLIQNNVTTAIGNQSTGQAEQFFGEIDELRIWNIARTPAQLTANMFDLPNPTTQANLRAYYKFDGNVLNIQGNAAFNGTWVGTPAYGTQPLPSVIPALGIQSVATSDPLCFGDANGSIEITATGSNLQYSIDGTNYQTGNQFPNLTAGTYTAYIRSQEGCVISQTSVQLTEPTELQVSLTKSDYTSCIAPNGEITSTVTGGTAPYNYLWLPGNETSPNLVTLSAGNYGLGVQDANGCTATATETIVDLSNQVALTSTQNNISCAGLSDGSATIQATNGVAPYTYTWTPASAGTTNTISGLSAGTYSVVVVDAVGCQATTSVTITNPTPISVIETITPPDCGEENGSITTLVTGGSGTYTYMWMPNGETTSSIQNIGGGTYDLTVTDGNNCSVQETYTVTPVGDLGLEVTPPLFAFNAGDTVSLNATTVITDNVTIFWSETETLSCTDCPNPFAYPIDTETYIVYATTPDGCIDSVLVTATIIIPCGQPFVPTIFSPNADGINDFLTVIGNCLTSIQFSVYDRWGELVFKTDDIQTGWDGFHKGQPANSGTYAYKLKATQSNGVPIVLSGNVTLVR